MDKFDYNIKVDKMKKLVSKRDFRTAAEIADSIDWRKIKNTRMLSVVSMIYERNHRFRDAKDIMVLSYEQSMGGRRQLYKLVELSVKEHNFKDAEMFYKEYEEMAPDDAALYTLKYRILSEQNASLGQRIEVLESYREREFDEQWAYELAKLYHKAGREEDCVRLCDEIILWFSVGPYVQRAANLKQKHKPLTPDQEEKVLNRDKHEAEVRQIAKECAIQLDKSIEEAQARRQAAVMTGKTPGEGEKFGIAAETETVEGEEARNPEVDLKVEMAMVPEERNVGAGKKETDWETGESIAGVGAHGSGADEETGKAEWNREPVGIEEVPEAGETGWTEEPVGREEAFEAGETGWTEKAAGGGEIPQAEETERIGETVESEEDPGAEGIEWDTEAESNAAYRKTIENTDGKKSNRKWMERKAGHALGAGESEVREEKPSEENVMNNRWEEEVERILSIFNKEQEKAAEEESEGRQNQQAAMVPGLLYVAVSSVEEGVAYATDAIRELHRSNGVTTNRVAKIAGTKLNMLGMEASLKRIKGADLVVLEANSLSDRCLAEILWLTQKVPMQMIIVLMDTEEQIELLDARAGELMVDVLCRIEREERAKKEAQKVQIRPVMMPDMAKVEAKIELTEHEMEAAATGELQGDEDSDSADFNICIPEDLGLDYSSQAKRIDKDQVKANLVSMAEAMVQEKPAPEQNGLKGSLAYQEAPAYQEQLNYQASLDYQEQQAYQGSSGYQGSLNQQEPQNYQETQAYHDFRDHEEPENRNREISTGDFVTAVKKYADELDCVVEEMAGLAIYAMADRYVEVGVPLTEKLAMEVTEAAVIRADKRGIGALFAAKYDKDGRLVLKESHFKMKAK